MIDVEEENNLVTVVTFLLFCLEEENLSMPFCTISNYQETLNVLRKIVPTLERRNESSSDS